MDGRGPWSEVWGSSGSRVFSEYWDCILSLGFMESTSHVATGNFFHSGQIVTGREDSLYPKVSQTTLICFQLTGRRFLKEALWLTLQNSSPYPLLTPGHASVLGMLSEEQAPPWEGSIVGALLTKLPSELGDLV